MGCGPWGRKELDRTERLSTNGLWASLVAQMIKNPPAMWETWAGSLGQEEPLEREWQPHSSILAWRIYKI